MILALSALLALSSVEGLLFQVQQDPPVVSTLDSAIKGMSGYNSKYEGKPASDDVLLKRLFADLLGLTPTDADLKTFADDPNPAKRALMIEALLLDPRFNDFWARRFTRVFFGDPEKLSITDMPGVEAGAVQGFERWLRDEIKKDTPWTDIVYRILNARGVLSQKPEAAYVLSFNRDAGLVEEFPRGVAQHFLGIRLYCAKCHDHPFDKWRAEDFYGLSSFIIGQQATLQGGVPRIAYREAGDATMPTRTGRADSDVKLAAGGKAPAFFLFGGSVPAGADRMTTLAEFMTQKTNSQLPRAFANRVWGWIFDRGLVDPVDDFNLKNKSMSTALLETLVRDTIENGYSLKRLVRIICRTKAYQMEQTTEAGGLRQHLALRYALGDYVEGSSKIAPAVNVAIPEAWKPVRKRIGSSLGAKLLYRVPNPKDPARNAELAYYETKSAVARSVPQPVQWFHPKTTTTPIKGELPTMLQELSGTLNCHQGADGPVEWTVLTAAFETPQGVAVAFRLEGPPETVAACRADFETLLKTVAPR